MDFLTIAGMITTIIYVSFVRALHVSANSTEYSSKVLYDTFCHIRSLVTIAPDRIV